MDFFNNDEEEDDYFLEPTEAERWFDDHLGYFKWMEPKDGFDVPFECEMFYYSVFLPFMEKKNAPILAYVHDFFECIKNENRPEVLDRLNRNIEWVCEHTILKLFSRIEQQKTGKDIREFEPEFDGIATRYYEVRKPSEPMTEVLEFWDKSDWITEELRSKFVMDYKQELEDHFQFKDKRRSGFFAAIQGVLFPLYPALQDLDNDGWIFYFMTLYYEYYEFWMKMEDIQCFIEYGFEVEDLNLPNKEYREELNKRIRAKMEAEREERIKKLAEEEAKKNEAGE